MEYIGWQNFKWILTDKIFWTSLSNTLIMWVLGTLPQVVIGIILAYALNSVLIKLKTIFWVLIFFPYLTLTVAFAIFFLFLFIFLCFGLFISLLCFFWFSFC